MSVGHVTFIGYFCVHCCLMFFGRGRHRYALKTELCVLAFVFAFKGRQYSPVAWNATILINDPSGWANAIVAHRGRRAFFCIILKKKNNSLVNICIYFISCLWIAFTDSPHFSVILCVLRFLADKKKRPQVEIRMFFFSFFVGNAIFTLLFRSVTFLFFCFLFFFFVMQRNWHI